MKHTEQEAIVIAQNYKKKYSNLNNNIKRAEFHDKYNVKGDKAWVVISEFELFGDIEEFYYVISDETGEVEYTFNEVSILIFQSKSQTKIFFANGMNMKKNTQKILFKK